MDNLDMAEKYGISEKSPYFFSEECLKFYSKNDVERIEKDTLKLFNLQFSGYEYDANYNYYIKTGNTISYEHDGKKYDLFEYKDCFVYYIFLCNKKLKKFRYIIMSDYKDFCEDGVYLYKDKYYCHYYNYIRSLLFLNRNEYIRFPGPFIVKDLKKPNAQQLISKYIEIKNGYAYIKPNTSEFYENNDEAILVHFNRRL